MKSKTDPRHLRRQKLVQALFEWEAQTKVKSQKVKVKSNSVLMEILAHLPEIDKIIEAHATKWPKDKINQIDIAILRLSIYELEIAKNEPVKVILDEAVELAKEFGTDHSPEFINGVLGALVSGHARLN